MWIKICGIRDRKTAELISHSPVSAVGLNFFAKSVRSVNLEEAVPLAKQLQGNTELVGLFVNHDLPFILTAAEKLKLNWIQLHGEETPEFLAQLRQELDQLGLDETRLIKAFRVGADGLQELESSLNECEKQSVQLDACLLDAAVKGEYGGTGQLAPWKLIRQEYQYEKWPRLILAGGLKPDNVQAAIQAVKPWGVDLASGVETSPGVKEPKLIQQLIEAVAND